MDWVTCTDPRREVWRRLLEFANEELAVDALERIHGKDSKNRANYKKQASQIRGSILQAREYTDAASAASQITAPNHLYYAAVSLASAIMLLHGKGVFALDYLRKDPQNRNHGLEFTLSSSAALCKTGVHILENARVGLRDAGHFRNWYSAIPKDVPFSAVVRTTQAGTLRKRIAEIGTATFLPFESVPVRRRSLMDLTRTLPDFALDLRRFGINVAASRTTIEVDHNADTGADTIRFRIHGAGTEEELHEILWRFGVPSQHWEKLHCVCVSTGAIVTYKFPKDDYRLRYPEVAVTDDAEAIMYGCSIDMQEIADAYQVAFGLSMLSRYFPDVWLACLESHCKAAKIIERFVEIYIHKFPSLAISYMVGRPMFFSTRRAPNFD